MKKSLILQVLAAAALLCGAEGCIKTDSTLGGSLIVVDDTYDIFSTSVPITDIDLRMADSLSGYSSTRITVGAIRDEEFGLTTRASVITLVPLLDTMDFGTNPQFLNFHVSAAFDTVSVSSKDQLRILQNLYVYEPDAPLDIEKNFDINTDIPHGATKICAGSPVLNGADSLSFNLSAAYGSRYFTLTQADLQDYKAYMQKFPGLYLCTDEPLADGGRINMFELQLNYDSDYKYIKGNYARLSFRSEYDGHQKDSTFMFYLSATDFYDVDSLLTNSGFGSFPQYCLNLTGHSTAAQQGKAGARIAVEGGGGLKPCISAAALKQMASDAIVAAGGDPSRTVINKASLVFPFEYIPGMDYDKYPVMLSPTCRFRGSTTTAYMGLTDASSANENQGDINYSLSQYAPDITYHMQEILKMSDSKIASGNYDIWLLVMASETVTTTTAGSSEMSDYYKALAYSQYYNNMYSDYGGYGYGYGYGSYYGDPYSNYTSYMLAAQYAGMSSTTSTKEMKLDKDRFYAAVLNGPTAPTGRVPRLELTFSVPRK